MSKKFIRVGGARQHNLKDVSIDLPRDQLVVITGLSGSGKSSLAFDTIYAEGQRKYVESLSVYARQYLNQLQKPEVDFIEGLSPAIAIEQRSSSGGPRSTIATTTEIYDFLRLLYAHVGQFHCPDSGEPIERQAVSDIVDHVLKYEERTRVMLLAPVIQGQKGEFRDVIEKLALEGFVRARVDGNLVELDAGKRIPLDPNEAHDIEVIVDRLVMDEKVRVRLGDSLETCLKWGNGVVMVLRQSPELRGVDEWEVETFSSRMLSRKTGRSFEPPEPRHFSFNSPQGACDHCLGLGQVMRFDEELVVPDGNLSLEKGAVLPWTKGGKAMVEYYRSLIHAMAAHYKQSVNKMWRVLPKEFQQKLLFGTGEEAIAYTILEKGNPKVVKQPFEGVIPNMENTLNGSESEATKRRLKAFLSPVICPVCDGARLKPEVLSVTLNTQPPAPVVEGRVVPGYSIMDVCRMGVSEALQFFDQLDLSEMKKAIATDLVREVRSRLSFLEDVGLAYLTLDRESATLSGGEMQRIRLATQIGAGLAGVLYVLDEPSIGLHQRDNEKLLETMTRLRDLGNSVLVVEHDEDTIKAADYVVDMGPGAGVHGGEVVAQGTPAEVTVHEKSLTGKYLRKELIVPVPKQRTKHKTIKGSLEVRGATENNLKNINVKFPLGLMTCVTGVSGSGKSTLVNDIIYRAFSRKMNGARTRPGKHKEMFGMELIDKIIEVDQKPLGKTPRSNPATFTGMFGLIRDLFARVPTARVRGYDSGRFSFNVKGGRCEKCQGDGVLKVEMHFLPPVYVLCDSCEGRRYNRETLEVTYKGLNIADVLDLTVDDAIRFFRAVPKILDICQVLAEVGLGYIRLGQQATTLSGGEAQRVKLAAELCRKATGRTLYIFDEPTTGLHFYDVAKLMEVLFKLRDQGNTLLVIEHNLDVIKCADWIVDMGPEGGSGGGEVVCFGTPEQVIKNEPSHTARFLKTQLEADAKSG